MGSRTVEYTKYPSEGVQANMKTHVDDGEWLDTEVELSGSFAVSGAEREEFIAELGKLIDRYRI